MKPHAHWDEAEMKVKTQLFARILDGETCLLVLKDLWGVGGGLWLTVGIQILRAELWDNTHLHEVSILAQHWLHSEPVGYSNGAPKAKQWKGQDAALTTSRQAVQSLHVHMPFDVTLPTKGSKPSSNHHCAGTSLQTSLSQQGCWSAAQSCLTLWNPKDCSMPGFPVLHHLLEFAQTHIHWISDVIQPSSPLSPLSLPVLNLSQHQGLFQWVGSSHEGEDTKSKKSGVPQLANWVHKYAWDTTLGSDVLWPLDQEKGAWDIACRGPLLQGQET